MMEGKEKKQFTCYNPPKRKEVKSINKKDRSQKKTKRTNERNHMHNLAFGATSHRCESSGV